LGTKPRCGPYAADAALAWQDWRPPCSRTAVLRSGRSLASFARPPMVRQCPPPQSGPPRSSRVPASG